MPTHYRDHQVEIDIAFSKSKEKAAYCTQEELDAYLAQYPYSALAQFYEYDSDRFVDPDPNIEKFATKVTALLSRGSILFPHQTLDSLSQYLQNVVFDTLILNPDYKEE